MPSNSDALCRPWMALAAFQGGGLAAGEIRAGASKKSTRPGRGGVLFLLVAG
ncbi:hypothetical protein ACFU6R_08790 [Streptomyces sp. NPDC057499]|uniref:hypothetical protein n=1 Tax=Streptomyces sp. NPDC057499 TaxID=3346150 RepID=UPI003696D737